MCTVRCFLPAGPEGSIRFVRQLYFYNETVELSCQVGYSHAGIKTATCQSDGTFTDTSYQCAKST